MPPALRRRPSVAWWTAVARRAALLAPLLHAGCASAPPTFEAHRVPLSRIDHPAPAKLPRADIGWKMKQYVQFDGEVPEPPNFADRFTLFLVGCGSGCRQYALIDRRSGRVHSGQALNNVRFDYRRDSRLLVVTHTEGYRSPDIVDYMVWNGTRWRRVAREVRPAPEE